MTWRTKAVKGMREVQVHPDRGWRIRLDGKDCRPLDVDFQRRLRYQAWMTHSAVEAMREAGLIVTHDTLPWQWGSNSLRYTGVDDE